MEPPKKRFSDKNNKFTGDDDAIIKTPRNIMSSKKNDNNDVDDPEASFESRWKVDQGIVDELLLVCGVIGTTTSAAAVSDDQDPQMLLVPVTDCLNWLQDLQRALRRDDDNYRPISLLLSKWNVVPQKLLPLVMSCRYDTPIVLTIVKILVILTKPLSESTKRAGGMIIDTKSGKVPEIVVKQQIKLRDNALEQANMLMDYKRAITHHPSHLIKQQQRRSNNGNQGGLLSIFVSLLAEPLSKTGTNRSDADHLTIELVLHLLRNVLCAEPILKASVSSTQQSNQLHQELIALLERELVLEILLVVGQEMEARENSPYNLLMMEIIHHLLRSQDPTAVARSNHNHQCQTDGTSSSSTDKGQPPPSKKARIPIPSKPTAGALSLQLQKEKQRLQGALTARHSNFGGTIVVNRPDGKRQNHPAGLVSRFLDSASIPASTNVMKRKSRQTEPFVASNTTFMSHTRRAFASSDASGPTAQSAQRVLHTFCQRFLENCYGPVMKSLKNEFRRDSARLENEDKVIFFRIVWFFSQWWRVSLGASDRRCRQPKPAESEMKSDEKSGELGQLIFTMDIFTFNLVLNATDTFFQHKQYPQLAQAVALYCEMMHLLHRMYQSKETTEQLMALGLMDRLFYASEPLDRLPKLLSKWSPSTNTRDYLCDLVELCHVTLKLLEANSHDATAAADSNNREKADAVARMKESAADFDVTSYLSRKIISTNVVDSYIYLLTQYSLNTPHVNHHIIAFFIRLCKFRIATSPDDTTERDEMGIPKNLLATKTVTLEPMLYNIKLITLLNKILNDTTIRNDDSDFSPLLTFAVGFMHNFYQTCQANPLMYVECLFRHVAPHRFCDLTTNLYVSEELRMMAERELLLEETRKFESQEEEETGGSNLPHERDTDDDDDDDEPELEFVDDARGGVVAAPRQLSTSYRASSGQAEDNNVHSVLQSKLEREEPKSPVMKRRGEELGGGSDLLAKPKKLTRVIDDDSSDDEEMG